MALHIVDDVAPNEVTLSEAADLLGVHPNTVRNRIKSGAYTARKIRSVVGPEVYLLDRSQLDLPTPPPPPSMWHILRQAFWSDDPKVRRVQQITWIIGGVVNAMLWAFMFGRGWEQEIYERREGSPRT
jgi:hypothetical protein